VGRYPTNDYAIITEVFSTITSPVFSELIIVLDHDEIGLLSDVTFFEIFPRIDQVRPFALVFSAKIEDLYHIWTGGVTEVLGYRVLCDRKGSPRFSGLPAHYPHNRTNPRVGALAEGSLLNRNKSTGPPRPRWMDSTSGRFFILSSGDRGKVTRAKYYLPIRPPSNDHANLDISTYLHKLPPK